jgi:dTDP-4-amino-4,6-dideoxygalactose transaminase
MVFFAKGRHALAYGLKLLHIAPGSAILIPAYICDPTIVPLRQRGYKLIFVDIDENFDFNLTVVERLIKSSNIKAILAPHYFGFPAKIKDLLHLCNAYGVKVIEDCAHSFLSKVDDKPVGSFGHIAIYSMRKTLAVPDGGALKINFGCTSLPPVHASYNKKSSYQDISYLVQRALEKVIVSVGRVNIYSKKFVRWKDGFRSLVNVKSKKDKASHNNSLISPSWQLKAYLENKQYLEEIALKRCNNFETLVEKFRTIKIDLLLEKVPTGCVPQVFIVKDETGGLCDKFRDNNLGATQWPGHELPLLVREYPRQFPVTHKLNNTLVMLPLHQSAKLDQLNYMAEVLDSWLH